MVKVVRLLESVVLLTRPTPPAPLDDFLVSIGHIQKFQRIPTPHVGLWPNA